MLQDQLKSCELDTILRMFFWTHEEQFARSTLIAKGQSVLELYADESSVVDAELLDAPSQMLASISALQAIPSAFCSQKHEIAYDSFVLPPARQF